MTQRYDPRYWSLGNGRSNGFWQWFLAIQLRETYIGDHGGSFSKPVFTLSPGSFGLPMSMKHIPFTKLRGFNKRSPCAWLMIPYFLKASNSQPSELSNDNSQATMKIVSLVHAKKKRAASAGAMGWFGPNPWDILGSTATGRRRVSEMMKFHYDLLWIWRRIQFNFRIV